jgi:hypothetical protein
MTEQEMNELRQAFHAMNRRFDKWESWVGSFAISVAAGLVIHLFRTTPTPSWWPW